MASKAWALLMSAVVVVGACGGSRRDTSTAQPSALVTQLEPVAGFRYTPNLVCKTELTTFPPLANHEFQIKTVAPDQALVGSTTTAPKVMRVLEATPSRIVYQRSGEAAGSVDTISLDQVTGQFLRQWSGWDPQGRLNAGAERGRCRPDDTDRSPHE